MLSQFESRVSAWAKWDSLSDVTEIHSWLELLAILFFAALVILEVASHFTTESRPNASKRLERVGLLCFAVAVLFELAAYPYSRRNDALSSLKIAELNKTAAEALRDAGLARQALKGLDLDIAKAKRDAERIRKDAEDERTARVGIEERVEWRRLTGATQVAMAQHLQDFSGQLIDCNFMGSDMEAFSFASDIASALRTAQWQVIPPSPFMIMLRGIEPPTVDSPIVKLETGVRVQSTDDLKSVSAAIALAKELNVLGFDAQVVRSPEKLRPREVYLVVEHRPQGAQGEAKVRLMRKLKTIGSQP